MHTVRTLSSIIDAHLCYCCQVAACALQRVHAHDAYVCSPHSSVVLQIPKLIALASVAVRVQWQEADQHLEECTTNLLAAGGVLHLDILSLPSPASKINSWTLRAVTPDTQVIRRHDTSKTNSWTLHAVTPDTQVIHRHDTSQTNSWSLLAVTLDTHVMHKHDTNKTKS